MVVEVALPARQEEAPPMDRRGFLLADNLALAETAVVESVPVESVELGALMFLQSVADPLTTVLAAVVPAE